jgi:type II secretory pathway pseudopilin PulG
MHTLKDERGATLIEIVITIIIVGTAFVAIVALLGTLIRASDAHQSMAKSEVILRDYAESIKKVAAMTTTTPYDPCPDPSRLEPTFSVPDWTTRITSVDYWIHDATGATFPNGEWVDRAACTAHYTTHCPLGGPSCGGLQRATLEVSGPNSRSDYGHTAAVGHVIVRRHT